MQSAVTMAVETATAQGAIQIHVLRMRVGVLSGVVSESLEFAFEVVARGTAAEGARLEIETVPLGCWCDRCQAEFTGDDLLVLCPVCHAPPSKLLRGRELEIASVEVS